MNKEQIIELVLNKQSEQADLKFYINKEVCQSHKVIIKIAENFHIWLKVSDGINFQFFTNFKTYDDQANYLEVSLNQFIKYVKLIDEHVSNAVYYKERE